jgi:glycosyltransferase involved in cell wall biosynthesis
MRRLIFVTGSRGHGGAERHAITLVNRLAERGHECHAIFVKREDSQRGRIRLRDGGTVRCLDAAWYLDPRAVADLAVQLRRLQPSAIVAANPYALLYCWLALRIARLRVPLVVTYHSTRLLTVKECLQMAVYRPLLWTAECLVFVCETQKRHWLQRGVFARRNEVIYNGVDVEEFCDKWNAEARENLRYALGFSDADYVIGSAAVLRPEKNHVQLVDAIALLRGRGIAARALMIGDGPMRGVVEARARRCGVERYVTITGFQGEVRPYIAACDAMALCSLTEALPLAAVEAMALCKPVVHSDVGGAAELICAGENGFLFPVGDTRAFVDKLSILADRSAAGRMGKRARRAIETFFSERSMVDRYERLLLELCRGRPGVAAATRGVRTA